MARKRGLGKGLNALLGSTLNASPVEAKSRASAVTSAASSPHPLVPTPHKPVSAAAAPSRLPVDRISRGRFQPRIHFDETALQELADSIRAQGLVQPVVVRPNGQGEYELIAGERRWRAVQLLGLADIPAIVKDIDDAAAAAIALIENIQREDLNPLEEARALERLQQEFELTHQQIADAVGRSRASVSNLLRLLDLDRDVKKLVEQGHLEMGHARALLPLETPEQRKLAYQVDKQGLSVRATEALVRRILNNQELQGQEALPKEDPNIRALASNLSEKLGAQVSIRHGQKGKGKLEISYNSLEELDGILAHIN